MAVLGVREFLAAHAPLVWAPWFAPVLPEKPAESFDHPPAFADVPLPDHRECSTCEGVPSNWRAIAAWEKECVKQWHVQWPWAWADAILAAGEVKS